MHNRALAIALAGLVALAALVPVLPAVAAPSSAPILSQVEVSNVSDFGFTVTWVTNELANGYVRYGTSDTQLSLQAYDTRGAGYIGYTHYVNVTSLVAVQTYWFAVVSGDTTSSAQSVRTGPSLGQPPVAGTLYGIVRQNDGQTPAAGALVQAYIQRGSLRSARQAALTADDGRFQIDLALARAEDNNSYFTPVGSDIVRYQVNGGPQNLLPYDGPSGSQRFDMQLVLDGEGLPDVILPNASLPTATPARSPTPTRTRTPTAAATAGAATATPSAGALATPSATRTAAVTAQPSATPAPSATAPTEATQPAVPRQPSVPTQPIPAQPTIAPAVTQPTARPQSTATGTATGTALLRPVQPIDPAARATRTALAALIREPSAPQATPPVTLPTVIAAESLASPDPEGGSWMPTSVRVLILVATLMLAVGLGIVTAHVVRQLRGRGQRVY